MDKQNNKLTEQQSKFHQQDNKSRPRGAFIVIIVALSPVIFYLYKSFPDDPIWETSFFTLSTGYGSWFNFAWYICSKLVPLLLFLIWFFTCKHWWHWIILVPIGMYSFQLWNILQQNKTVDEVELIYILPMMMVIVPFVYLIRAKLFEKIRGDDLKQFEEDLMENKSFWQQVKDLFR
ncbi:hypothetical protein [Luteirhabdus pelagi]|uniref:hypothetical protein n=1 Tax=Luteirhabdus pelagi TaxID=2792783 RepID=UPI00193965F6|nr:hypothetical protein [Luteirhabdus pelagi]